MKILLVNKYLMPKGGAETYVLELGRQLARMGHDVQYFGMDNPARTVGNDANAYVSYIDFHSGGFAKLIYPFKIIYSLEAKKKMEKVLYDFMPDIVHINNFNYQLTPSIIYAVLKVRKKTGRPIKIVYTAHDIQLICPNHMMINPITHEICERCVSGGYRNCIRGKCIHGSRLRSVIGAAEGWIYKKLNTYRYIDLTVYPSRFISEKMNINPALAKNHMILHNFVMEEPAGRMEKDDYALYFGRYSIEKGIKTLLEACRMLPRVPFKFAGNGPLEAEVNSVENVENVGFQSGEALKELVGRARFSLVPSKCYENCPFSVIESITLHTPVIGANIGGIPELIDENKTGLLFESGNAAELQEKIEQLWNDPALAERMSINCADVEFDNVSDYCEKLLERYRSLF